MGEANLDIVQGIYAGFDRRDLPACFQAFAEDIRWIHPDGMNDLGVGGTKRGHQGVRAFLAQVPEVMAGLRLEPQEFITSGNRIVVFGKRQVTAHSGAAATFSFIHSWTLRQGVVTAMEDIFDTYALRRFLGY